MTAGNNYALGYDSMDARQNIFFSMLIDYAPLFLLGFCLCFLKGLAGVRAGYVGRTVFGMVAGLIIQSTVVAAIAVGAAMLLPLAHVNSDPATMIGVVVFITVLGLRFVDALVYKKLGIHIIDTSTFTAAEREWAKMSEEERTACMESWNKTHKEHPDGE